ncbi:MAG: hypothetical protein Q9165_003405 [Trypethelium subeluteriae]
MAPKKSAAASATGKARQSVSDKKTKSKSTGRITKPLSKMVKDVVSGKNSTTRKVRERPQKTEQQEVPARKGPTTTKDKGKPQKRKQEEMTTEAEPHLDSSAHVAKRPKLAKKTIINRVPAGKVNVYVCGSVSAGELGLGPEVKKVKRPRINKNLPPDSVGVVQVAVGGMHVLALTFNNEIYSWGVNDKGALGRETTWEGGFVDMNDADDASDAGMNPLESTPAAISKNHFPQNTVFTQVAAGDSSSFAVTDDGHVYGWGTFRDNEGKSGFTLDKNGNVVEEQRTPILLPSLKRIVQVACGADHVLARDDRGQVFAWGNGQQSQLGRRTIERTKTQTLLPSKISMKRGKVATAVGCGAYHSFAIDQEGGLWSWGLNSFAEAGHPVNPDEEIGNVITFPEKVDGLDNKKMKTVEGGAHHSIGVTTAGECLVWGRVDMGQCGIDSSTLPEQNVVKDVRGNTRILSVPTPIPGIKVVAATAGSDHSIAVTTDGKAYSWGFNATFQTGQGGDDDDPDDITIATLIDNTALREAHVNWAGAGGQFSVITATAPSGASG